MSIRKSCVSAVEELALRLVKLCVGEEIWQYEHDAQDSDMSLEEISAAGRLARELELRNPKAVARMDRAKCIVRVTADVARTMFSKKTEKVSANVKLEKWEEGEGWSPDEVSFSFRREPVTTSFDEMEESSIPPLLPQKPRRVPKERPVVVILDRFTTENDRMLIHVEGGYGIGGDSSQNDFYGLLMNLVDDLTVTSRLVSIEKQKDAEWANLVPILRRKILNFFGSDTKIVERTQHSVPEEDDEFLGETEMESIRESMRGCALTEDERAAIGMSDAEYEDGLD